MRNVHTDPWSFSPLSDKAIRPTPHPRVSDFFLFSSHLTSFQLSSSFHFPFVTMRNSPSTCAISYAKALMTLPRLKPRVVGVSHCSIWPCEFPGVKQTNLINQIIPPTLGKVPETQPGPLHYQSYLPAASSHERPAFAVPFSWTNFAPVTGLFANVTTLWTL